MRERIRRVGHVGLAVRDLDRAVDFYTGPLGLTLTERFEYPEDEVGHGVLVRAGAFVRVDSSHHCLSIFAFRDAVTEPEQALYGLHHLAFELDSPGDLVALYRRLRDAGAEIVNARKGGPGNQPRFYVRDPDGNLLEFYWGIDAIGWDGQPRAYPPIEEIDLESFDFDAYVAARERDARDWNGAPSAQR